VKEKIRRILARREKKRIVVEHLPSAAVLLPLYEKGEEYYILFTRRTETVQYHKGQISFPGGAKHEDDDSLVDTALRECAEEIGVDAKEVEVLGELDDIVTRTSNYIVSPFVATILYPYPFEINQDEVEGIIEVPLAALLDKRNFREETQFDESGPHIAYFYEYNGQVIWGATAQMLKQFLDLVFEAG
jgi:8-oxo-dGTP pyrophosphatase MutT (NUDIX family)